jgi:hypothetical protein
MSDDYELAWRRNPGSRNWQATDDRENPAPVYVAGRDETAAPGRQWTLAVAVPGRPGTQARTGFSSLKLAQAAALDTRCHLCFRYRPFAAMEPSGPAGGWRCRDHEDCAAVQAARDAEMREVARSIRDTNLAGISIRDAEDGPELVFRREYGHGQASSEVVRCTERDLIRLAIVLLDRIRSRARAALDETAIVGEPPV